MKIYFIEFLMCVLRLIIVPNKRKVIFYFEKEFLLLANDPMLPFILFLLVSFAYSASAPKEFSKFALQDFEGKYTFSRKYLASLSQDEKLLISFWNTQCLPCRQEIPILQELTAENTSLKLLLISLDPRENSEQVQLFAQQNKFTAPILLDIYQVAGLNNGVCHKNGNKNVCKVPALFLLNRQGQILHSIQAFENKEKLLAELKMYLPNLFPEPPPALNSAQ